MHPEGRAHTWKAGASDVKRLGLSGLILVTMREDGIYHEDLEREHRRCELHLGPSERTVSVFCRRLGKKRSRRGDGKALVTTADEATTEVATAAFVDVDSESYRFEAFWTMASGVAAAAVVGLTLGRRRRERPEPDAEPDAELEEEHPVDPVEPQPQVQPAEPQPSAPQRHPLLFGYDDKPGPHPDFLRVQPEAGPAPVPFAHWGRPAQPAQPAEPEPQPSAPSQAPPTAPCPRVPVWPPAGLPDVPQARAAERVGTWGADQTRQRDALASRVTRCPGCGRDLDVASPYAVGLVSMAGSNNHWMQVKCGRCKRLLVRERTYWRAGQPR